MFEGCPPSPGLRLSICSSPDTLIVVTGARLTKVCGGALRLDITRVVCGEPMTQALLSVFLRVVVENWKG